MIKLDLYKLQYAGKQEIGHVFKLSYEDDLTERLPNDAREQFEALLQYLDDFYGPENVGPERDVYVTGWVDATDIAHHLVYTQRDADGVNRYRTELRRDRGEMEMCVDVVFVRDADAMQFRLAYSAQFSWGDEH